jgi:quaternary ammonium compound-resistance protein SugE
MAWFYLLIAGLLEIVWAVGLKYTAGFTRLLPTVITVSAMALSLYFLGISLKTLPIGTAYAIWTGIGALGAAILGMVLFKEPATLMRIFFILLLMIALIGLKMTTPK